MLKLGDFRSSRRPGLFSRHAWHKEVLTLRALFRARVAHAITALTTGLFLLSCENDLARVNAISSKLLEVSVETSRGIEVTYSDSATVKAVLTSPLHMSYMTEEPYDLMPEGLQVIFYDDSLQVQSTLTAKYGRRDIKKKLMEVRDSVVVVSSDGRKLETEELIWEEETDRIYSNRFVKITEANGDVIQGPGLETNSKFDPYKILGAKGQRTLNVNRRDTTDTATTPGPAVPPGGGNTPAPGRNVPAPGGNGADTSGGSRPGPSSGGAGSGPGN